MNNALDNEKGTRNITSTMKYFHSISEYMLELRKVLEELRDDIEYVFLKDSNFITGIFNPQNFVVCKRLKFYLEFLL